MDEIERRLTTCFAGVFPDVPVAELRRLSQASNASWDSITAITLVAVLEEEFGFELDFEALPELDSFERVLNYVRGQVER